MMREYLINAREKFNENVKHYGNKVREGLGDTLTADVTAVAPVSIFLGTWIGINCYTALQQQASGLVDRSVNAPEYLERLAASTTIMMQGGVSNIAGIVYGLGAMFFIGGAVVGLDNLTLREENGE
ncbi:hypothetical protein KY336_03875 [Candidatus Woesearchaeota archaeon]|nr:hypothetical protein [Candidatus Woesearchaeota archaeon]